MKTFARLFCGILTISMVGCAVNPQSPIPLSEQFLNTSGKRVGIVMSAVPKVTTSFPGAGCLLCLAVASGAHSTMTKHVTSLPAEGVADLKEEAAKKLAVRGIETTVIAESINVGKLPSSSSKGPNAAKKLFSAYKEKYNITHLAVIDITSIGVERPYSSYIPTGVPQAVFNGTSYIVNLENNTYESYKVIVIRKGTDGKWDELTRPLFLGHLDKRG